MPSSRGSRGSTPECFTTGRVPSAASMARLTVRSSTVLFHVGTCWDARARRPRAARRCGSPNTSGEMSRPMGSLCPHHTATDGWWASMATISVAWRWAWRRMDRA